MAPNRGAAQPEKPGTLLRYYMFWKTKVRPTEDNRDCPIIGCKSFYLLSEVAQINKPIRAIKICGHENESTKNEDKEKG